MHLVCFPRTFVLFSIGPIVTSLARYLIVDKLSFVVAAFREYKLSLAVLSSSFILPAILGAIGPSLFSLAVLLILEPLTLVLSAVGVYVLALPMSHVIQPFAFIEVAICMIKLAVPGCSIKTVIALIAATVGPLLNTEAIAKGSQPFSSIDPTIR
jgi:hypothetical protein